LHTILHRTDLIVFPLTLQTITTALLGSDKNDPQALCFLSPSDSQGYGLWNHGMPVHGTGIRS